ncbi:hypothetical protein JHK85_025556 [Glycine max]|nr:hypothetical protein JHK85_025556 [Glycine max]
MLLNLVLRLGEHPINLKEVNVVAGSPMANLYTNDDTILCRVFPTSLKGTALTWYGGLPPRFIDSFNTFVGCFNSQYATSQSHPVASAALASLRQANDKPPTILWIDLTRQKREKGESSLRTDPHKSDKRHKLDKCQPFQKGPRYERYIPLIENRAIILEQDFNVEVPIQLPPIPPSRPSLDRTKYCRYHHNHGHNIKDCWALKDKIEELIQAGYLAQFVEKPNKNKTRG